MNRNIKDYIILAAKGASMGAADVIPGVSGGTIAFMTGIYEELISSINKVDATAVKLLFGGKFKEFWKHINGPFLLAVFSGILLSVFSLAKLMSYLLVNQPIPTWAFFFGLIIASSIHILRGIKSWKILDFVFLVLGIGLGTVICTLSPTQTPDAKWFILICGAVAICAMILPGISGSFILLILGKYDYILGTLSGQYSLGETVLILAIFALGAVLGLISFSRFLHWLLGKWNRQTIIILAGFIIGSLVKVWPWHSVDGDILFPGSNELPIADAQIGAAISFAIVGMGLVFLLEFIGNYKASNKDKRELPII